MESFSSPSSSERGSTKQNNNNNNQHHQHQQQNGNRRRGMGILAVRTLAAISAVSIVGWSLYYDVTSTHRLRMRMVFPNGDFPPPSSSVAASDLQIYSHEFRVLYEERRRNKDDDNKNNNKNNKNNKEMMLRDPSSWTQDQRRAFHRQFERHSRESMYALLIPNTTVVAPNETETSSLSSVPSSSSNDFSRSMGFSDTAMIWGIEFEFVHEFVRKRHKQRLYEFHDVTGRDCATQEEKHNAQRDPVLLEAAWKSKPTSKPTSTFNSKSTQQPRLIKDQTLCAAYKHAKDIANYSTPHVLLTHLNENWGGLSSQVPNRTSMWGDIVEQMWFGSVLDHKFECDPMALKEDYLDHPNTLAVFTVQHQSILDHPKIHSIPIGIARSDDARNRHNNLERQKERGKNHGNHKSTSEEDLPRPKLFMINSSPSKTRVPQMEAIASNFEKAGVNVSNSYNDDRANRKNAMENYYSEMSSSKYILCPSGMGWDAYRIWEAITMGTIPVIERHRFRYEAITYPPETNKRPVIVRTLNDDDKGGNLETIKSSKLGQRKPELIASLEKGVGTLGVIEYLDGWRKSMEDLPVLWIDGNFQDAIPPHLYNYSGEEYDGNNENNNNNNKDYHRYLTPALLEKEYDKMVAKMKSFRYEKMTTVYWMRFLESFLLLEDPTTSLGIDGPTHFASSEERHRWKVAMESLAPTYSNHSMLGSRLGKGWDGWKEEDGTSEEKAHRHAESLTPSSSSSSNNSNSNEGQHQGIAFLGAWILWILLKVLGLTLLVVGGIQLWK